MTDRHLPQPVTTADIYAASILDALDHLNATLGDIRDRLPQPEPVAIAEPAPAQPDAGAVPVAEPAPARVTSKPPARRKR